MSDVKKVTVYQCPDCLRWEPESACGWDGETVDRSRDECHHPLSLEFAQHVADALNAREIMKRRGWGVIFNPVAKQWNVITWAYHLVYHPENQHPFWGAGPVQALIAADQAVPQPE